jgi:lipid II:glycine glycyltransferase (peptidoglycan interpeptide bridge formation enzyme)
MIVTLNLDDNIAKMQKKITRASAQANRLVSMRKNGRELLKDFDNSLDLLSRV